MLTRKKNASESTSSEVTSSQIQANSLQLDELNLKVLIDGAPGVGKTTLTWKASQEWARGKLFKQHKLVIRISLRELPDNPESIWQILPNVGSKQLRKAVEESLLDANGKETLFILDGWDELSVNQRKKGSILYKLIRGDLLSHYHLSPIHFKMVTASRHGS